ncbi:MAG: hypothetical protein VXW87_02950 [Pseudomonadota bacterium]|nr:hypothetical protein [Pseudomonadota bacterium]
MFSWLSKTSLSKPYTRFIVLSTQSPDAPTKHKPYTQRVYELRQFLRFSFIEIFINTYQGTLLRSIMVTLQKHQQLAFTQIAAGAPATIAIASFKRLFPVFAGVTVGITFLNVIVRLWRTRLFYDVSTRLIKIITKNAKDFTSVKSDQTDVKKDINQSLATDRNPKRITDIPKGYHNLTQNMILAPLEITMYLFILGANILSIIAIISLGLGIAQTYLSKKGREAQKAANESQQRANSSEAKNHSSLMEQNLASDKLIKLNEIYTDFTKMFSFSLFQVALMFACAHFIFMGSYDMAMVIAQTATGTQAFQRISKYIGLIKNHGDLNMNMNHKAQTFNQLERKAPPIGEAKVYNLEALVNKLPSYKWSLFRKVVSYSAIGLSILGLIYTPLLGQLYALLPTLTRNSVINLTGISIFTGMLVYKGTKVSDVDSSLITIPVQIFCLYFGLASGIHFAAYLPNLLGIISNNLVIASLAGIVSFPLMVLFDQLCIPSILFILDHIATWLSQEFVSICKVPEYVASNTISTAKNLLGIRTHQNAQSDPSNTPKKELS